MPQVKNGVKIVEIKDLEYQLGRWHQENKMVLQMKPDYTCSMPNGKVICWVIESPFTRLYTEIGGFPQWGG